MSYFKPYETDIAQIFREAERRIQFFPQPLNEIGRSYMNKFNPLHANSANNYICYLLPYWMKDITPISDEQCAKLSLANVFGMLYFFIQDDVMDSDTDDRSLQLTLSHLFHLEMYTVLRSLYDSSSPFWHYYHLYVTEWANSVLNESRSDYFNTSPLMVSKKSGPVKIASTGALLLSNNTPAIPIVEDMVEHVLVSLQMADDWVDWETDLHEGSYNCLLALISHSLPHTESLSTDIVTQYLYEKEILSSYLLTAIHNDSVIKSHGLPATNLFLFHDSIVRNLTAQAERLSQVKKTLLYGGFDQLLSKLQ